MKTIEIDEQLYQYLMSTTEYIGESASSILRRLLSLPANEIENERSSSHEVFSGDHDYQVETTTPKLSTHTHSENVLNYINKEELTTQRGVVGRFLLILSALHRVHAEKFAVVKEIRGRDRLYFATSEQQLAQSGSSTKPRQIPDSQFWVMTNSNTTRKKMMLTEVTKRLGYSDSEIEMIRDLL